MFAIYEGLARINGVPVETFEREVLDGHTIMRVEAGTTGYTVAPVVAAEESAEETEE